MIEYFQSTVSFLDTVTIFFAFFAMLAAGKNYLNDRKQLQEVQICFNHMGQKLPLDLGIMRKHISRAEVMGILGVIQKDSRDKYNIDYLSTPEFMENIFRIQKGELDEILIEVSSKELEQFNVENT